MPPKVTRSTYLTSIGSFNANAEHANNYPNTWSFEKAAEEMKKMTYSKFGRTVKNKDGKLKSSVTHPGLPKTSFTAVTKGATIKKVLMPKVVYLSVVPAEAYLDAAVEFGLFQRGDEAKEQAFLNQLHVEEIDDKGPHVILRLAGDVQTLTNVFRIYGLDLYNAVAASTRGTPNSGKHKAFLASLISNYALTDAAILEDNKTIDPDFPYAWAFTEEKETRSAPTYHQIYAYTKGTKESGFERRPVDLLFLYSIGTQLLSYKGAFHNFNTDGTLLTGAKVTKTLYMPAKVNALKDKIGKLRDDQYILIDGDASISIKDKAEGKIPDVYIKLPDFEYGKSGETTGEVLVLKAVKKKKKVDAEGNARSELDSSYKPVDVLELFLGKVNGKLSEAELKAVKKEGARIYDAVAAKANKEKKAEVVLDADLSEDDIYEGSSTKPLPEREVETVELPESGEESVEESE